MSIEKMSAVVETEQKKEVPLHAKEFNCLGHSSKFKDNMATVISGRIFSKWDEEYLILDGGRNRVYDELRDEILAEDDPRVAEIIELAEEDIEISEARDVYTRELAEGDEVLAYILRCALDYGRGQIEDPEVQDGITLYKVGRNASHEFFLGFKDGKLYKAAFCPDVDENGKLYEGWSGPKEIDGLMGLYLGHS
ncbi:MAG: hypothetical protein P1P90_04885 [Patescibacteria group bacterium]|nr:hypothetical protein [Patescibacteria group bacterium]